MNSSATQLQPQPGTALVLSGGATKAFYFHLGVLRVLGMEGVSAVVGTSAGAVLGALLASGVEVQTIIDALQAQKVYSERQQRWINNINATRLFRPRYRSLTRQSLHSSLESLKFFATLPFMLGNDLLTEAIDRLLASQTYLAGFFDATVLEELFALLLETDSFSDTAIDLYITATPLDSSQRMVFNSRYHFEDAANSFRQDVPISRAVKASSAIPGIFEPVEIGGRYFVDGEVHSTPSADIGVQVAERVIVSYIYQPALLGEGGRPIHGLGWVKVLEQSMYLALHQRILHWRQTYARQSPGREILWIHPDPQDEAFFRAPLFSFRQEIQQQLIASGEAAARRALAAP